jgi:hypothetical protein
MNSKMEKRQDCGVRVKSQTAYDTLRRFPPWALRALRGNRLLYNTLSNGVVHAPPQTPPGGG